MCCRIFEVVDGNRWLHGAVGEKRESEGELVGAFVKLKKKK